MTTSTASAVWEGGLKTGKGNFSAGSGAFQGAYSFSTRFEGAKGTNPEELIAAAHAACLSMALAAGLEKAGTPAKQDQHDCLMHHRGWGRRNQDHPHEAGGARHRTGYRTDGVQSRCRGRQERLPGLRRNEGERRLRAGRPPAGIASPGPGSAGRHSSPPIVIPARVRIPPTRARQKREGAGLASPILFDARLSWRSPTWILSWVYWPWPPRWPSRPALRSPLDRPVPEGEALRVEHQLQGSSAMAGSSEAGPPRNADLEHRRRCDLRGTGSLPLLR